MLVTEGILMRELTNNSGNIVGIQLSGNQMEYH